MSVSIITPIYNRADLINGLFESLNKQTLHSFEWIIIDDGSTDNLEEIVNRFKNEATYRIVYKFKDNGGKHTALNIGIPLATNDWVFIVDSDDSLCHNAIKTICDKINKIQDKNCKGLVFLRAYETSKTVMGDVYFTSSVNSNQFAGVHGDKAIIFKRESFFNNQFPVIPGEKFITEAYLWNRILEEGYFQCWNEIIYYGEYLDGGLTSNYKNLLKKNPNGTIAFVVNNLNLKDIGLNIYKQTVFHFLPIFSYKNIKVILKNVKLRVFIIFMACLVYTYAKSKVKGVFK